MTTNVYVLRLEGGKYYVGKSNDPDSRVLGHFTKNGCAWTRKYKPVEVVEFIIESNAADEDKVTKQYMAKYGIQNVRGASYCQVKLKDCQLESLEGEMRSLRDECFKCGEQGHMARFCKRKKSMFTTKKDIKSCSRCGRKNHSVINCYAKIHVLGHTIQNESEESGASQSRNRSTQCSRCGRNNHTVINCYAKTHYLGHSIKYDGDSNSKKTSAKKTKARCCSRCGRPSHSVSKCYAKTHIEGYDIDNSDASSTSEYESSISSETQCCLRCGRNTHLAIACYARTHIQGHYIQEEEYSDAGFIDASIDSLEMEMRKWRL